MKKTVLLFALTNSFNLSYAQSVHDELEWLLPATTTPGIKNLQPASNINGGILNHPNGLLSIDATGSNLYYNNDGVEGILGSQFIEWLNNGTDSLTFNFSNPVSSFSMEFWGPRKNATSNRTFEFSLPADRVTDENDIISTNFELTNSGTTLEQTLTGLNAIEFVHWDNIPADTYSLTITPNVPATGSGSFGFTSINYELASVPEPSSVFLLAIGGLGVFSRRKRP